MSTVLRRDVFGWGALGLSAVALDGCSAGVGSGAAMGPDDALHLLDRVDAVAARMEALRSDPTSFGIKRDAARVAEGHERSRALLTALCFIGAFRDMPEAVKNDPRVSAHFEKTLPRVSDAIADARDHMAGIDDAEMAGIDQRLRDDADLPMRIMERIDGYAKEVRVPHGQRMYLRLKTAELAARFRYEGAEMVTAKVTGHFDRILAMTASPAVRENLFGAAPKKGKTGESCTADVDCEDTNSCKENVCTEKPRSARMMHTAKEMAKWGGYLFCPFGPVILLLDLFLVIVAGIVYAGES